MDLVEFSSRNVAGPEQQEQTSTSVDNNALVKNLQQHIRELQARLVERDSANAGRDLGMGERGAPDLEPPRRDPRDRKFEY